ncbi:MAG: hypothetical protein FWG61_04580, partial [Firmicutes bacterium]|nr:hypothetical protein [Bacillota bacterium]
ITTYEKTDVTTWKKIIKLSTGVWTIMIFEVAAGEAVLSYVYMYADDEEWYVYDLNTQELTKEKKDVLIKVLMEAKDGDWYYYNLLTHEVIEKIPNI